MLQDIIDSFYDDDLNRQLILRDNNLKKSGTSRISIAMRTYLHNTVMDGQDAMMRVTAHTPLTKLVKRYHDLVYGVSSQPSFLVESEVKDVMRHLGWPARKWDLHRSEDLSYLFSQCPSFNEDIGNWDVSGVTSMEYMFVFCKEFNQDLSCWNTGKVKIMTGMFYKATSFNSPLFQNVEHVENFDNLFAHCHSFNQDISGWNTSNVDSMSGTFYQAHNFNQDIGGWNTGNVTCMKSMFKGARRFNQDISNWDVANVTVMANMFEDAESFNCDLYRWDVSERLSHVQSMFKNATSFNGMLYNPDECHTGGNQFELVKAKWCQSMFEGCINFNQLIPSEFAEVKDMSRMFYNATSFNQDIVCQSDRCDNFSKMFYNAINFNGDIYVEPDTFYNNDADLSYMFFNAKSFNQDISDWNVSPHNLMVNMFNGASSFNQDLNNWNFFGLGHESDYHLNGIFVNCTSLDVEMTDWFEKFISESEDLDIYQYFAGSEKMLALFFAWKEENKSGDGYA